MSSKRTKPRAGGVSTEPRRYGQRARRGASSQAETTSDPYQELLSEAVDEEARPQKRRRVDSYFQDHPNPANTQTQKQTAYDDSPSSGGSDVDWEEIELQQGHTTNDQPRSADKAASKDISFVIGEPQTTPSKRQTSRRLPASAIEKKKRLDIHKVHVSCLLSHVYIRNTWCNDGNVQSSLMSLLSNRTISYLNPDSKFTQFQRTRSFFDGLQQACDAFRSAFKIIYTGMHQPLWFTDSAELSKVAPAKNAEPPLDKKAFLRAAKKCEGSRDTGAQLFCAMLRGAGVDARLVCSLQSLSFASAPAAQTAQKAKPTAYYKAFESDAQFDSAEESATSIVSRPTSVNEDAELSTGSASGLRRIKRFGGSTRQDTAVDLGKPPPTPAKRSKLVESRFPVFWVEAFNTAQQKWVPVDPVVTKTISKVHKFEPPTSDSSNVMSYVVAFADDRSARDVSRRYAKAYNAKTRRVRIEATKNGYEWWRKVMKLYKRPLQDRDQVEDAELANKEASEPIPRNVQDFKNHPYYALERHLRHNEVIHPKREAGKLNTGKDANVVEPIYRRRDVQIVQTADKWYRKVGLEIKPDQQPLKYAIKRRSRPQRSPSADSYVSDDDLGVGMYAKCQTSLYKPSPIVDGNVTKNAFGNLDVYVSSMIPPGGVHIRAREARNAAAILGIDCADAVTGFDFKGRRGTAVINGVVVARKYREAMEEVVQGLRWEKQAGEEKKQSKEALRLWKRFLMGLKVRERIMGYHVEGEVDEREVQDELVKAEEEEEATMGDGGFLPDLERKRMQSHPAVRFKIDAGAMMESVDFANGGYGQFGETIEKSDYDDLHISILSPWDPPGPLADKDDTSRFLQYEAKRNESEERGGSDVLAKPTAGEENGDDDNAGGFFYDDEAEEAVERDVPLQHASGEVDELEDKGPCDHENSTGLGGEFLLDKQDEIAGIGLLSEDEDHKDEGEQLDVSTSEQTERQITPPKDVPGPPVQGGNAAKAEGFEVHDGDMTDRDEDLMSEDPEDEEAVPDWLENQTVI